MAPAKQGSPADTLGSPADALLRKTWISRYDEFMNEAIDDILRVSQLPRLSQATLVLAFSGWMDGGDVSTGTVGRLIELTGAQQIAEIDPEPFYITNLPGSMEMAALFRPHVEIRDGLVRRLKMPTSLFYCHEPGNLVR
jgi:hypothetical protein